MKIVIALLALALLATQVTTAESRSVTFFSDGAIVELEATAIKGSIELPLPAAMIEGSLRIKPGSGTSLQRVDIIAARLDSGRIEKELDSLIEQRSRLSDRLQALATREEIFKAAAKSQSGKAPRKSKSNPDPMQTIRQGTEFAIAQLEAVYTARRRTEEEIRRLDNRMTAAKKSGRTSDTAAHIRVSPPRGVVTVRYALAGTGWTPRYDIHLDGGTFARISLSGRFSGEFSNYLLRASPASLADYVTAPVFTTNSGQSARLVTFNLPVSDMHFGTGLQGSFSCVLKNTELWHLPDGDANLYKSGEYFGRFRFEGISSGRTKKISAGL